MTTILRKKLIDIGCNLTDPVFRGIYNGSQKHSDDFEDILSRAQEKGIEKIIVTGGNLQDSVNALKLAKSKPFLYSTVGCHPTRCKEFEKDEGVNYLEKMLEIVQQNSDKVVAIGEFGLDYDRLEFCPKDVQVKYFEKQLEMAERTHLPLFLHCRNAAMDLVEILKRNRECFSNGVVHSFDGSLSDAKAILDLGLHIGINGCSLKTQENLDVLASIPKERLMIETDCPWCDIRPTHASYKFVKTSFPCVKKEKWKKDHQVKGRNEPVNIIRVLEVLAAIKEENEEELADILYQNTMNVFFSKSG